MKRALITGIAGMDGSHLADYLLETGYEVYGLVRRKSTTDHPNIDHIEADITLIIGDLQDQNSIVRAVQQSNPDEIYNLGAQSFVAASWSAPEYTADVTGLGALRVLEAIREYKPDTRFYQAASSEQFGTVPEPLQNETTPFHPASPYAAAKVFAHWTTVNYRESHNIFASNGICFNHESPRRGLEFVTRKIANGAAKIALGLADQLALGNLDAERDWGWAPDYVRAMHMILQHDEPDDFVIATGKTHSVREFCQLAFGHLNLDYCDYVVVDPQFLRPVDVKHLRGDTSKVKQILGWQPTVSFEELVESMVKAEYDHLKAHC